MFRFSIHTSRVSFDVELKDKYILIDGDSGKGKSLFVSEVLRVLELGSDEIHSDLPVYVIRSKDDINALDGHIAKGEMPLLISDEVKAPSVLSAVKDKRVYCILVTRKVYAHVNMSYRSLYVMNRSEEGVSYVSPKIQFYKKDVLNNFDVIITEDSKAGYNYISNIVAGSISVVSAKGKCNIVKILKQYKEAKKILVVLDAGGIASDIQGIKRVVSNLESRGCQIQFCLPECFEHILLCSEYVGWSGDIFKYFDTVKNNTETFCEETVEKLTVGHPYEYDHSRQVLTKCWVEECANCCSKMDCKYTIEGPKIVSVLKNGPAAMLLHLTK